MAKKDEQTAESPVEPGELTAQPTSGDPLAETRADLADAGRARRREMLSAMRANEADQDQRVAHPTLRKSSAYRGLSRRQIEAIGNPLERERELALWEEANEAHLQEGFEEPERDASRQPPEQLPPAYAAAAESASDEDSAEDTDAEE